MTIFPNPLRAKPTVHKPFVSDRPKVYVPLLSNEPTVFEPTVVKRRLVSWWGPDGATVWVVWNPETAEIEKVGGVNPSSVTWQINYIWKDRTDSYTLTAGMSETEISIPVGQRKFLRHDGSLCRSPDIDGFNMEIV